MLKYVPTVQPCHKTLASRPHLTESIQAVIRHAAKKLVTVLTRAKDKETRFGQRTQNVNRLLEKSEYISFLQPPTSTHCAFAVQVVQSAYVYSHL